VTGKVAVHVRRVFLAIATGRERFRRRGKPRLYEKALKESDPIYELLSWAKTIAVVGLSESPMRPSHGVSAYMQAEGYKIIPVNPRIAEALGEKAYPSLLEMPLEVRERIDLVDVFRRPEYVDEIVEQAIQLRIPAIWLQEGVVNEGAAEKARKAGMFVVMDQCVLKEHRARFG
jgi:predicted CoA-binding protein